MDKIVAGALVPQTPISLRLRLRRQHFGVELCSGDLRIDVIAPPAGPCAVRVTHIPTGIAVTVDDQATIKENRDQAITLLADALEAEARRRQE